ncbi:MAG: UDP-N-acetylmuramoyl-L-alanine--D-glutamate ligase [Bdellovibrionales bacterium]|jgi:UDP-N-acetylmuramoylalanine--D-glutamate ligase|nr:UDP-N-acetylmuramoyl-L-alanine--D-glutamate ligase [Bdellovibrionales bacterium]MBT3526946.1 UDP-N-acetylmuramoyl-L-alanine--D-glutamate ligase [Bdellovibrionales bacterium]MBT7670574.1 UDP-N-acetylmuramoyl-L-alanine--D-glutamate ligase [Bdellovibrionales bacterium]MBT7767480.1 UDP-N-acetylmuramoyl-L-alanine--D-glutamate ligase [Bdellovibrionales bacterium]
MNQISLNRVTIFGPARSGYSALRMLVEQQISNITMIGQGESNQWPNCQEIYQLIGNDNCLNQESKQAASAIASSSVIILSPGIPREHPLLQQALIEQIPVISEIELTYQLLPIPRPKIVAITGTNGKTTTTTIVGELIEATGKSVFVGGNIGIPMAEYIANGKSAEYMVLELSSFQLESITTFHPHVVLFLNIFQNHGERYTKIDDYFRAKTNIVKNMDESDHIILPNDIDLIATWGKTISPTKHWFTNNNFSALANKIEINYSLDNYQLVGGHNIVNLYCATKILEVLELDNTPAQKEKIGKAINLLEGVPHRLQPVKQGRGEYLALNDAKSTNWDATLTALETLGTLKDKSRDQVFLILGGQGRNKGDSILPYLSRLNSSVTTILLIGDMAQILSNEIGDQLAHKVVETVEQAISFLDQLSKDEQARSILLFSPAFPSFDQYSNYVERGEHFISLLASGENKNE